MVTPVFPDPLAMSDPTEPSLVVLPEPPKSGDLDSYSLVEPPSVDPTALYPAEDSSSESISVLEEKGGVEEVMIEEEQNGVQDHPVVELELAEEEDEVVTNPEVSAEDVTPVEETALVEEVKTVKETAPVEEPAPVKEPAPVEEPALVEEPAPAVEAEDMPPVESIPPPEVEAEETKPVEAGPSDHASSESDGEPGDVSDVGIPDVPMEPQEKEEEPNDGTPKKKPICHVISAGCLLVTLVLLSSSGEENLPNRTEATLSSLLLGYLVTYAAVDQEILSIDKLSCWLNCFFNLLLCPFLATYLAVTVSQCTGVCDLGLMVPALGALLGVELWVLVEHLEPRSIAQGMVGTLGAIVLHQHLRGIGEAQPIIPEDAPEQ